MSTGLAIMSGIAGGIEKATNNIFQISMMKEKLKREKEVSDLDKKVKETLLKKYEYDPDFDPEIAAQKKDLLDKQYKSANALYDLHLSMQDAAKKGETEKLKGLQKQADTFTNLATGFKLGATGNIDEQVKRKVATGGLAALSAGEKAIWDRGAKKNTDDMAFLNGGQEAPGSEIPGTVPAGSTTEGKSDWWNQ
jgi:hypothetical protein